MKDKYCPYCDQKMTSGLYCKGCKRIVLHPYWQDVDYYLNERHPQQETDCLYQNRPGFICSRSLKYSTDLWQDSYITHSTGLWHGSYLTHSTDLWHGSYLTRSTDLRNNPCLTHSTDLGYDVFLRYSPGRRS